MRTIALCTQKGGSGKSTIATSLAVCAAQAGEQVIAIDTDDQGTLAAWGLARPAGAPTVAAMTRAHQLAELLAEARTRFGVAVIDTPGRDSALTHTVMAAADLCLVPIRPTKADAHGNRPTVEACIRADRRFAFVLTQCATTIYNPRAEQMAAGLTALGVLAPTLIGLRVDYQDAYAAAQGVTEYAPESRAADEIRTLWAWISSTVTDPDRAQEITRNAA
jgi:chromosome partitioning protein